ncbi:MAG: outer membrane beta-barrel protein [Crocinitomicaceae bacterium]|nr:outer membrane beta-barrel protein [Crocinitomicaceae bacterium]
MKKLLSLVLLTGVALGSQAQDKKFQIGLVMGTTVNWTKIQTTQLEKNGLGKDFTIGVGGNFMFNENVGIASGVQFDMGNFSLNYGSDASVNLGDVYYAYHDTEIKMYKDGAVEDAVDTSAFQLLTRTYRTKYITVPFFLKFQTSLIGQFKYYGKFGLRTSFLGSVRMDDLGRDAYYDAVTKEFTTNAPISERTMENMKPVGLKKELSPVKMAIGVYAGAEWNFTGNTFLYAELGFNYGIIPQLYPTSSTLVDKVETTTAGVYNYSNLEIDNNPQHMIEFKVGLLF